MSIVKRLFGKMSDGTEVYIFTLKNHNGMEAQIINFGGAVVRLYVPDRNGKFDDIVLGYDNLEGYLENNPHFGAIIGRYANRIENSEFELNGVVYHLNANDGRNHLHGGLKGYDKVLWNPEIVETNEGQGLQLTYRSMDGEENYPGNLDVKVIYTLTDNNELKIYYLAVSDKDTIVNLTNHSYFNLSGHNSGSILNHKLYINADRFTPINDECIPTGEIRDVFGTPMDFTKLTPIGIGLDGNYEQIVCGRGYDHNFVLNRSGNGLEKVAEVVEENSGRVMEVYTTKPGIQFYSGNFLDGEKGKDGAVYTKRSALCLETQYFPNSLRHKNFPSPILRAGDTYKHTTVYKFSVR